LASALGLTLSHEKILKYSLVHDLPEVYAGDMPLFSTEEEHARQDQAEADAILRLRQKLSGSDLIKVLEDYYALKDEESKFVRAMDKLVALFVHIVSERTQFEDNKISKNDIERALPKWRKQTDVSPEMEAFTTELLDVWNKNVTLAPSSNQTH
jgi:5'-deoxynucleotidase YfbR-like HD superfamily hydrolase